MTVIPFPSARALHPSRSRGFSDRSRARFVEDASVYGFSSNPGSAHEASRIVARHHLFRLGFGECPDPRRTDHSSPIVARRGSEVVGVIVSDGELDPVEIARARRAAETEAEPGETISAAIMRVGFIENGKGLRVEIIVIGSPSLQAIPPVPFE